MARVVILSIPPHKTWVKVPHEAARLAATLEQAGGEDPRIVDLGQLSVNRVVSTTVEYGPDLLVMWVGQNADQRAEQVGGLLHAELEQTPLLAVGPGVQPESCLLSAHGVLDGAVIGAFNEVVIETTRRGQVPVDMRGVAMGDEDGTTLANLPAIDSDPDEWGLPAYHLVEIDAYQDLPRPGLITKGGRYWIVPIDHRLPEKVCAELTHLVAKLSINEVQLIGGGNLAAEPLQRLLALWRDHSRPPHLQWYEPLPVGVWTNENLALFAELGGYLLTLRVEPDNVKQAHEVAARARRSGMLVRGVLHSDAPRRAMQTLRAAGVDVGLIVSRGGRPDQAGRLARRFYGFRRRWRLWRTPVQAPLAALRNIFFSD